MVNQLQSQNAVIQNIKNQLRQIANALSKKPLGTLSSNVEINTKDKNKEKEQMCIRDSSCA